MTQFDPRATIDTLWSWALTSASGPQYYEDFGADVRDFELAYSKKPISAPWSSDNVVFGFWIGINDIGWGHHNTQPSVLVPTLMAQYEFLIKKLYASGGRKFLFLDVPPIDRSPMVIKEGPEAVKTYVTWMKAYNDGLQSMSSDFKSSHSDTMIVLYGTWSFMSKIQYLQPLGAW